MVFNWSVECMEFHPEYGHREKVVSTVHWRCEAKETANNQEFVSAATGRQDLLEPSDAFIDFDLLTTETVLNWIWELDVNRQEIETNLANETNKRIESSKRPIPEYFQRFIQ